MLPLHTYKCTYVYHKERVIFVVAKDFIFHLMSITIAMLQLQRRTVLLSFCLLVLSFALTGFEPGSPISRAI
jgi:hypothetical protein